MVNFTIPSVHVNVLILKSNRVMIVSPNGNCVRDNIDTSSDEKIVQQLLNNDINKTEFADECIFVIFRDGQAYTGKRK